MHVRIPDANGADASSRGRVAPCVCIPCTDQCSCWQAGVKHERCDYSAVPLHVSSDHSATCTGTRGRPAKPLLGIFIQLCFRLCLQQVSPPACS
jgi:hypothetical protein